LKGVSGFRKIWLWVFIIAFILLLLSSNPGQRTAWNPVEQLIIEITSPFQKFIKKTVNIIEELWLSYFYLINVCNENKELRKEIDSLRMKKNLYQELTASNKRLQELLQFKQVTNRPILAAQVIGLDPTGWFKSIIIDKGKNAGLYLNMPVVNSYGVVGRIVSVSPNYSKVLLIIDQNSAVDCLIQRSRERGMIKGVSPEVCSLDYVAKPGDVIVGDSIVTSGLGGVFPKGLSLGKVISVNEVSGEFFKEIETRPAVNFSKLEEVLVILKENISTNHQEEEK
jgi:rod shape-determining protein MreC